MTPADLTQQIKDILRHVQPLPVEAAVPIRHYRRTANDIWDSLAYIERALRQGNRRAGAADAHLGRLYGMALVNQVETFERFVKELAGVCVDRVAGFVLDDRFDNFKVHGSGLASHFRTGTFGKWLCEAGTWLDCDDITKRFRKLLSDPSEDGDFDLFPKPRKKSPDAEAWRHEPMSLLWQLRNASVHNVGVITRSDALKLRLLARQPVAGDVLLAPTRADLRHVQQFLDDTADSCNRRVGSRLAELLGTIHQADTTLFTPQEVADRLAADFRLPLVVAGAAGVVPAD